MTSNHETLSKLVNIPIQVICGTSHVIMKP